MNTKDCFPTITFFAITLYSMRRFVTTTIFDLGYQDFSEYFIGHSVLHIGQKIRKAEI
jgi:hypothetical protein